MIGAIIMTHWRRAGPALPPKLAPIQVVVLPIAAHKPGVLEKAQEPALALWDAGWWVELDDQGTPCPPVGSSTNGGAQGRARAPGAGALPDIENGQVTFLCAGILLEKGPAAPGGHWPQEGTC